MIKRFVSLFTALCMTLMLFDPGTLTVSATDPASHVHDMSVSCGGSGIEFQPYPGGSIRPGSYYLTGNVSHVTMWRIEEPGVYNLCLNGYSINPTRIEISENVTFNLCDCKGTGSITTFSTPSIYGMHIVCGEFNMYGGKLIGTGREDRQERGVNISKNGKFTMYAGEITGYNGEDIGGVALGDNGTFIMNGGKITNNTVQSEFAGAGVRSFDDGTTIIINEGEISGNHGFGAEAYGRFEINGGKIINNDKGGVIVSKTPYISGSPVIKDNHDKDGNPFNLSLSNNKLHITGRLGSGFEIGIASCDRSYIFTDNWNEAMGDADPADYFTSDSEITKVKRYSDEGALCVLLTLDTGDLTGIVGDIPDPAYYPRYMEVELPKNLKLKGHIFGGWSETPNRPLGNSSIELKGDTTVYPAFEACKHRSRTAVFKVEPTCTKTGFQMYVLCDDCGMTFESWSNFDPFEPGILPALGHDFGDWTTVDEATCTTDGTKEHVCQRSGCGKKETDIIPQTGHDFGIDYQNDDDQHWQICTKCGAESEKSDHTWDEGEVTKPSTETEEGEMTYKCTVCSATKTESIDKLHTHTYSPAWSSDDTYHWHESTCGHTDVVDGKEEHIFVDGKCRVCQRPDPNYETPTDTSVSETEPPETDPSDTESSDTQPPETDPSDTESSDTQPPETDPSDTESSDTQPPVTNPSDTEPTVTEPPVTEPPVTEPTATNPPYIPYYPPSGSPAPTPTVPVSKEPFLQDENGKIGWAVISDDIWATPDGETVRVNMNGTTELPKNIVSDIAGRDIDLVLIMNRSFTWTINGMGVDRAKTVDMRVRKLSAIPRSTVQEFFGDSKTVQIDLRHNGDFGFTAELTVDLGDKYSGKYANSYCYKSRSFEFGDSAEITDGQTKLRFTHASSWLITIDDFPVLEDVSSASAAHSAETPIDMSNSANGGVTIPEYDKGKNLRFSNKKRRYRILKKRRLDDIVFVY